MKTIKFIRQTATALIIAAIAFAGCKKNDPDEKTSYTVTFDSDGGMPAPSVQTVEEGGKAARPSEPVKDGNIFAGWFAGSILWDFDKNTVTGNLTLKAGWTPDNTGLASVAEELADDADFSLFAAALAAADLPSEDEGYTVFALPDTVILPDADAMPAADLQWHIVRGRYAAEDLLQAQTLQTVGGQTLRVVSETVETGGEQLTLLYINDIPVDHLSCRLTGGSAVYTLGASIARISSIPDADDLDAYNSWAAMAIEGTWLIEKVEKRQYHVWSGSGREEKPFHREPDNTHAGCREVFERNPAKAKQGFAGTYELKHHNCGGADMNYSFIPNGLFSPHTKGWWSVDARGIEFERELWPGYPTMVMEDRFVFADGIGRTIKHVSGYGGDRYYGGDENVIIDTYYETEYTLRKILN